MKTRKENKLEQILLLSKKGYNNDLIGKIFGLSRERIRQILQKESTSCFDRAQVRLYQSELDFIIELGKLGINPTEIHILIPKIRVVRIASILKERNIKTQQVTTRSLGFKKEEILDLVGDGFGLVQISKLVNANADNVKKVVESNGYVCIVGSGIYRKT